MDKKQTLRGLVKTLRDKTNNRQLTDAAVSWAVETLKSNREYDAEKFPPLIPGHDYDYTKKDAPETVAEALLWKLGKWQVYQRFAAKYQDSQSKPDKDVVLYAFTRHMRDPSEPIYDQHAIRALWAIDPSIEGGHRTKLRSLLFDTAGKWKETAGGGAAIECYELFVARVKTISTDHGVSLQKLDRLLMPLGQAIKRATDTCEEFEALWK